MKTTKKAFTLIEILIVIAILGILMVALVPRLVGTLGRGRDTARIAELNELATIITTYGMDKGNYEGLLGCADPDLADNIPQGYVIKSNFPKDPNPDMEVGGCGGGQFAIVIYDANNIANSAFAVFARVEDKNRGNISCADISLSGDGAAWTSLLNNIVDSSELNSGDSCYVITSN